MTSGIKNDILVLMRDGNLSMREVADVLNANYNNVTRHVRALVDQGLLVVAPPRPGDSGTTKRFKASVAAQQQMYEGVSSDRILTDAIKFIQDNHPESLHDKDELAAQFERCIAMMMRFPETDSMNKRRSNSNQAKARVSAVLREYERACDILRQLMGMDLVSDSSYPILRTSEARSLSRIVADRVAEVKAKSIGTDDSDEI